MATLPVSDGAQALEPWARSPDGGIMETNNMMMAHMSKNDIGRSMRVHVLCDGKGIKAVMHHNRPDIS